MKIRILPIVALLLVTWSNFAQNVSKIEAKDGVHYITTTIDIPITGTYYFQGTEPIVEVNGGGSGFYQLHEQLKRPVVWGIECDQAGVPIFKKGFDNAAYTFWYQYTERIDEDDDANMMWKPVEFSIHFNTQKMFIQGERCKNYSGDPQK